MGRAIEAGDLAAERVAARENVASAGRNMVMDCRRRRLNGVWVDGGGSRSTDYCLSKLLDLEFELTKSLDDPASCDLSLRRHHIRKALE
jgi:hypothetical protein